MDKLLALLPESASLRSRFQGLRRNRFFFYLTAPVIYSLIIPAVFMDLFVQLYQAVCFPVYGIPKVRHVRYNNFSEYGDEKGLRNTWDKKRANWS